MSIYQTAVKRPVTTILIFLGIAIFGLFSLSRLSIDLLPDIETNAIMVMTSYGGASAEDIETNITRPLENTLNSVTDLKHVTSKSREGISVITLEFEYGTDIDVATNDVRDKLDRVTTLPDGANTPILFKFGTDDIPILLLSVTAKESFSGLYKILDDQVATPLARVQGVGTVSISGLPEREIQIYCDPLKLEAYGITIETIGSIISAENKNIPAGSIDIGSNVYSMRVQKEFEDANEMLDLVVGMSGGVPVYLRDVARIVDAPEERTQESFTDGVQGGILVIQKQSGANSVNIARAVVKKLEDIKKTLPSDIVISPIIDTSDNIIKTIDSLTRTIATTLIIVSLVVLLFLGRWRATFVIVLTIPISLLSALTYLLATGNTLNIISMSALSIAIGMVVDNAIVVLENITTHIERGSRPRQAAMFATNEVAISVMASTLTTIAVFLPLTMVQGIAGIMFEQLGWMVTIILAVSTIGAITLTPTLCSLMLRLSHKQNLFQKVVFNPFNEFLKKLTAGYARLLHWCVRHRKTTIFIALALFFGSIFVLLPFVKTEFFPSQDNARISITIKLPTGTRQNITRDL
ncbi:MAG: efflux RND transporter permease subunit, partial [Muribaculaceae bacterium]|nr:efflux RND transporter permease subunit [Muribaculaceae bacterium]